MITLIGGTGTLGKELASQLNSKGESVTIFSRDELKQSEMRKIYPHFRYVVGDVSKGGEPLEHACKGAFAVFHLAALKQVDTCENNVAECIRNNLQGTINAYQASVKAGVSYFNFSSTDKAVLPINAYGMSKALAEKYLLDVKNKYQTKTRIYRWGNVIASRGSVIPYFIKTLLSEQKAYITHMDMTRFWLNISTAAKFMIDTYDKAITEDDYKIPPLKAASVLRVIETLASILKIDEYEIVKTDIRPGEKIHEVLYSSHDHCLRSDTCPQYSDDELRALLMPVVSEAILDRR